MSYPIRPDTARRRTARQQASAERREALWSARLAAADTPKKRAQVWYDRIRGVVSGNFPASLSLELWGMVVDDLQALCRRLEARVEQHRVEQQARQRVMPDRRTRNTFW